MLCQQPWQSIDHFIADAVISLRGIFQSQRIRSELNWYCHVYGMDGKRRRVRLSLRDLHWGARKEKQQERREATKER